VVVGGGGEHGVSGDREDIKTLGTQGLGQGGGE
jgi:hypothetical protein